MFIIKISLLIGIFVPNITAFMEFNKGKDYIFDVSWNRLTLYQFVAGPIKKSFEGEMLIRKLDDDELLFRFQPITVHNMNFVENDFQKEMEVPFKVQIDDHTIKRMETTSSETVLKHKYMTVWNFLKDYSSVKELANKKLDGKKIELLMPFGMCNSSVDVSKKETGIEIFVKAYFNEL